MPCGFRIYTFARIVTAFLPAGTNENVRNVFDVAGTAVHCLAYRIVDDGYGDFLQDAWQWTLCTKTNRYLNSMHVI